LYLTGEERDIDTGYLQFYFAYVSNCSAINAECVTFHSTMNIE